MIARYARAEMAQLWSEETKFRTWLQIELLACEAMYRLGQIPQRDWNTIRRKADFDLRRIQEIEREVNHDVIAFLTSVAEKVGPAARHIHQGMTSSDVVDTALAVLMVRAADILIRDVRRLRRAVAAKARKYKYTPMIGRTHGVHAEPITFGFKLALMYDEFGRAEERLRSAREMVRCGQLSGAVGTHAHLDPRVERYVCRRLGLRPALISSQVLQRDRHAHYLSMVSLVGCSVERWAQEFRHLARTEVREVEEFFAQRQKGSSAMPHKRNPILAERLCGLARVLRGHAVTAMENVPLWHERDISHSSTERIIIPDATTLLDYMLTKLTDWVRTMKVFPQNMQKNLNLTHGLIHSQQVLLQLVRKGLSREEAYRIVQENAMRCWKGGQSFRELLQQDPRITARLSPAELEDAFRLEPHLRDVDRTFRLLGLD